MHTAIGKGLVNGSFDEIGRIVFMQLQNADKFLYTASLRPFFPQDAEHVVIGLWPVLFPSPQWFGVFKCARSLLKQWQVVERIKNILFSLVATRVTSEKRCFINNVKSEGVCF